MYKNEYGRLKRKQNKRLPEIAYRLFLIFLITLGHTISSYPQDTLKPFPPMDNRWALVIGISMYKNTAYNLQYSDKDAQDIADAMESLDRVPKSNIRVLTNSEATREEIRKSMLVWLGDNVKENDVVFIYFSGHGSQLLDRDRDEEDGYDECIVPYDYTGNDYGLLIPDDEFAYWLRNIPSSNILLIMDCCFSGGAARVKGFNNPQVKGEIKVDNFAEDLRMELPRKGVALLSASKSTQVSFEDSFLKNGLFTYFLLQGLSEQSDLDLNRVVTDSELYIFIKNRVNDYAMQNHHKPQEPLFLDLIDEEIQIAFLPIKLNESIDNEELKRLKYQLSNLDFSNTNQRIKFCKTILEKAPNDVMIAQDLADLYQQSKNIDSAIHYYDYCLALNPSQWRLPWIHRGKGECYETAGDLNRAIEYYKLWFDQKKDPAALNRMARLYETMGKGDEAIALCLQSIKMEELQWDAYIRLLNIYFIKGDYKSAIGVASKGLEFNPENLEMLYRMGLLQKFYSGNVTLGDSLLSLYSKKTGADSILQSAIQRKQETLWIIVSPNDTHQVAEHQLLEAINNYPHYAEFYYALGEYYRNEKKDYKLAKKYYMDFIKLNPFTDKRENVKNYISGDDSKQKTHK